MLDELLRYYMGRPKSIVEVTTYETDQQVFDSSWACEHQEI